MINNLYEKYQFGAIPKELVVLKQFRISSNAKENDDSIFTCGIINGFTEKNNTKKSIRKESSKTLYVDNERINKEISSDDVLLEVLKKVISNYYTNEIPTQNRLSIGFSFYLFKTYIPDYEMRDKKEEISTLISKFILEDYLRMLHYNNTNNMESKYSIQKERTLELESLSLGIKDIFFHESIFEQEQKRYMKNRDEAQERLNSIKEQMEKLQQKKKEEETKIRENNILFNESKAFEEYSKKHGELEYEEGECAEVFVYDVKKTRLQKRTSQIENSQEFKKKQENSFQMIRTEIQQEKLWIPEEIRRKAQPFIEKGLIEEIDSPNPPHYRLLKKLTGPEFVWINTYLINQEKIEGLTQKEQLKYIYSAKNKPLKLSSHNRKKEPKQEKFPH